MYSTDEFFKKANMKWTLYMFMKTMMKIGIMKRYGADDVWGISEQ